MRLFIDCLNKACNNISFSYLEVEYESMGVIRFWNKLEGVLTYLSCIFLNMEPLGTNFNTSEFYNTESFLFKEIHTVKNIN